MDTDECLIIWGAGGHAEVVADIIQLDGKYRVSGFLDDANPQRWGTSFCGATILGGEAALCDIRNRGIRHLILAFGNNAARLVRAELATSKGFALATARHHRATIASNVRIGPGTVVAAGAVINPSASIGRNVIINTSASVDHGCIIADGVHVCPGVHLAGNVQVDRAAWVGIGATVKEGIRIGAGATIGAGSVVVRDVPPGALPFGIPARVIKENYSQ